MLFFSIVRGIRLHFTPLNNRGTSAPIRSFLILAFLLVLFAPGLKTRGQQIGEQPGPDSLQSIPGWLAGSWQTSSPGGTVMEVWRQAGERWAGKGLRISGADTTLTETLQIMTIAGQWYYQADVPHNPHPVYFKATRIAAQELQFENPDHDFPQVIRYRYLPPDSLEIFIAGRQKNEQKSFTIGMRRQGSPPH